MARLAHGMGAVAALSVAACGGGGSGASSGGTGLTLSLSTGALTFVAPNAGAPTPPSQTVSATISGSGTGTLYFLITSTGKAVGSISEIVITSSTTGRATVNPAFPAILGMGVFKSSIIVRACVNDPTCATGEIGESPQTVDVTYTVAGVLESPTALSYAIGDTTTAADLSRQITATFVPAQGFLVTTDVPWLSITPAEGNTSGPTQITVSLVQAAVEGMVNGIHAGSIVLSTAVRPPITVPVSLTIDRTQVGFVAPYVATSGSSAEVIIRGDHLSRLSVQDVKFGSSSATAFKIVSDTEVRATHPALTAGTYPIQLQNPQGLNRSLAKLVVIDPQVYAATTLSYPVVPVLPGPFGFGYDAERRALVVSQSNPPAVLRYQFSNSTWSDATGVPVPGILSLGLSIDGSSWLAGTGTTEEDFITRAGIAQIGATDLSIASRIDSDFGRYFNSIAPANDGSILTVFNGRDFPGHLVRHVPRASTFSRLVDGPVGGAAASADGSRIFMGSQEFPTSQVYVYDASSGGVSAIAIDYPSTPDSPPAVDRTGSRFLLNDGEAVIGNRGLSRVFHGTSFAALGDLPTTTITGVLSPDGSRAYTFDSSGTLRTFDLTGAPPGAGQLFPEIGTGTSLAGSPGGLATVEGPPIKMAVSPDGRTVFLAGGERIVVQPVP